MRQINICALAFFVLSGIILAQNDRGSITGTVRDQANAVVPGASVVAANLDNGAEFKTVTTGTGNYTVPSLPAGRYSVTAQAAGFKRFTQSGIEVQVAQTARIDVSLQLGSTSESITITAEATLLKTESAEQSTVVTGERLNNLPLNFGGGGGSTGSVRSPYLFNVLSPGVGDNTTGTGANVNGLQANTFRVQVDGQDAPARTISGGPRRWLSRPSI